MEPRSINRWQHRLKREHPTCTERTKALIEECGWKGGDRGNSAGNKQRDQQIPKRIPLTPTGLLMEGDYTNYGSMSCGVTSPLPLFAKLGVNECNRDLSTITGDNCASPAIGLSVLAHLEGGAQVVVESSDTTRRTTRATETRQKPSCLSSPASSAAHSAAHRSAEVLGALLTYGTCLLLLL